MRKGSKLKTIAVFVIFAIIMAAIIAFCEKKPEADEDNEIYQERIEQSGEDVLFVDSLIDTGVIYFYPETPLAYCDEDYWLQMSRRERMEMTINLGIYITNKMDGSVYWTNVYGMYTKKRLAVWSEPTGYKEYPFYDQPTEEKKSFQKLKLFIIDRKFEKMKKELEDKQSIQLGHSVPIFVPIR